MPRRLLVTSALPYANGHIHLGHLVEYIQTDIWVRFQKLRGNRCVYICADDTHGTAIMIRARQEGRSEEALIADMQRGARARLRRLRHRVRQLRQHAQRGEPRSCAASSGRRSARPGWCKERSVEQLYDPEAGTFLADRFVRGTCPKCKSPDQYGDNCSKCGHHYSPTELIDPVSTLSGATPELRTCPHLFIELETAARLPGRVDAVGRAPAAGDRQLSEGAFPGRAAARLGRLAAGAVLRLRDSRQPGQLLVRVVRCADRLHGLHAAVVRPHGEKLDDWWKSPDCEIHHFIGKDITYFHTLFWPACSRRPASACRRRCTSTAFSPSTARRCRRARARSFARATYLKHLDPAYLRYYYASKLSSRVDDLDLNRRRVRRQGELRPGGQGREPGQPHGEVRARRPACRRSIPTTADCSPQAAAAGDEIAAAYEACDYSRAMRLIMALADRANQYVDENRPWDLRKDPASARRAAGRLHGRAQPVPATGDLPGAGAAAAGAADGRAAERSDHAVGTRRKTPLVGHAGRQVSAHAPARRRKGRGGHDRRQQSRSRHGEPPPASRRGGAAPRLVERRRRRARRRAARCRVHDRRLRQGRPARRPRHRGRGSARGQEAAQAHAQPGRRRRRSKCSPASRRTTSPSNSSAGWSSAWPTSRRGR